MNSQHIELRGWIKDKDTREWVDYGMCTGFQFIGFPISKGECKDKKGNEFGCNELEWMRYIGMKDGNKKKIFEGDVLDWGDNFHSVVYYDEGTCAFRIMELGIKEGEYAPRTHDIPAYTNKPFIRGNVFESEFYASLYKKHIKQINFK